MMVYQDGYLDVLNIGSINSAQGGLYWLNPLFLLTLIGLALDYELFLFARIWEFREEGYDNRSAVVLGTTVTGPIISTAGLIMAFSFSSFLASDVGMINQFGFLVTVGVVIDTFLIRNLLAPCIFVFLGDMNYWPHPMPKVCKNVLGGGSAAAS